MNHADTIRLIIEASLALAGFAGIITVLSTREGRKLPVLLKLSLTNLLSTSLGALFLSLLGLILLSGGVSDPFVWRAVSGTGLIVTLYFASYSIRTVRASRAETAGRRSTVALLSVNVPLLMVCFLQVWNLISLAAFWPVLTLLTALFAIGCYSFVRLIFAAA